MEDEQWIHPSGTSYNSEEAATGVAAEPGGELRRMGRKMPAVCLQCLGRDVGRCG